MLFTKPKTVNRRCKRHGLTVFVADTIGTYRCRKCRVDDVNQMRKRKKKLFIDLSGGGCIICGYSKCTRALQFHHLDPKKKKFGISGKGMHSKVSETKKELSKCVLLCANCHAEVEAKMIAIPKRKTKNEANKTRDTDVT